MSRKSAASLATPTLVRPGPPRLSPPKHLTAAHVAAWHQVVDSLPPGYFRPEVATALERRSILVVRLREIEAMIAACDPVKDLGRFDRLVRLAGTETGRLCALDRSLRITNQSRTHPSTAGSKAAAAVPERTPADDREAVLAVVAAAKARR